jgi:hypothetical protein
MPAASMSWWQALKEGRRLRPQTVEPVEPGERLEVSEPLGTWLGAAFGEDEGAEQREAKALAQLRAQPEGSLRDIVTAYDRAPEHEYALRWALVYGAAQLGLAASVGFLARVLEEEIPPERSNDIHLLSTVAEETSLRCQAVRGIADVAEGGDDRARESLLAQLSNPSYTVRVIACQALRGLRQKPVPDDEIRRRLSADEAEGILAIRQVSVEELEPLLVGAVQVTAPRPPGGESGTELDARRTQPPIAARQGAE